MVSHLRMTHFSLIVGCLTIAYTMLSSATNYTKALKQINQIIGIVDSRDSQQFPVDYITPRMKLVEDFYYGLRPNGVSHQRMTSELSRFGFKNIENSNVSKGIYRLFVDHISYITGIKSDSVFYDFPENVDIESEVQSSTEQLNIIQMPPKILIRGYKSWREISEGEKYRNSSEVTMDRFIKIWNNAVELRALPKQIDYTSLEAIWKHKTYSKLDSLVKEFSPLQLRNFEHYGDSDAAPSIDINEIFICDPEGKELPHSNYFNSLHFGNYRKGEFNFCLKMPLDEDMNSEVILKLNIVTIDSPITPLSNYLDKSGLNNGHNWQDTNFKYAFPELSALVENLSWKKGITLNQLKINTEFLSKEISEKVSMFGLSINQHVVALWGPFSIIFIQIYFYLHFAAFRNYNKSKHLVHSEAITITIPWILFYRELKLSKLATIATLYILPPSVCLIPAIVKAWNTEVFYLISSTNFYAITTFFISLLLAGAVAKINHTMRDWRFHLDFTEKK